MRTRSFARTSLLLAFILFPVILANAQQTEIAQAEQAYAANDFAKAVPLLKKVVKANGSDAHAWQMLGSSYLSLKKYKDAVKACEKAVSLKPTDNRLQSLLAFAYLTVRDGRARSTADAALQLNPKDAIAHYILGVLSYRDQMYVHSYDRAKRAIQIDANFAAAYRLKSQALVASFLALTGKVLPPGASGDLLIEATADLEKYMSLVPGVVDVPLREELAALKYFANYYSLPENRLTRDTTIEAPNPGKTPLKLLEKPKPAYTDSARQRNVQGTCVLLVAFDVSGKVGPIMVVKSLDDDLDRNSISAARGIRYIPPTKNGVPFSTVKQVEYTYSIY